MHDADGVRGGEPCAGLQEGFDDGAPGARRGGQPGAQGGAGDELHREVDAAVDAADVVYGDDVGVREAGHRLRLAEQAGLELGIGRAHAAIAHAHELDGDLAVELGVVGGEHDAHRAAPEHVHQQIAADPVAYLGQGAGWQRGPRRGGQRGARRERGRRRVGVGDERATGLGEHHAACIAVGEVRFERCRLIGRKIAGDVREERVDAGTSGLGRARHRRHFKPAGAFMASLWAGARRASMCAERRFRRRGSGCG